jgi:uncharacterized protein
MTLIDANLLLYAYDSSSAHHERARVWLSNLLSSPELVALAWVTILAFLRIGTDRRLRDEALSVAEAAGIVSSWIGRLNVTILTPSQRHWEILQRLLKHGQAAGRLVMDAHLAALALEHGATLATSDRDFTRFPELRIFDPLAN